jgi:hypothetical protein
MHSVTGFLFVPVLRLKRTWKKALKPEFVKLNIAKPIRL